MTKLQGSLLALAGGISYGFLAGFTKMAYGAGVDTGPLTTFQSFTGFIMLWLLFFLLKKDWTGLNRNQITRLLMVGTLPGLTGAFYYLSLKTLPSAIAIILLFQFTWMGGLLEYLVDEKKPNRFQLIAVGLLLTGTLLAVGLADLNVSSFHLQGVILGLLSAFTYTGFLYCTGKVAPDISPWVRSPLIVTGSLIINLIVFPPTYLGDGIFTKDLFLWGGLMGLFGPVIPTVCLTFGVPVIGGGLAAILGAVELPMVLTVAYFALGEKVGMLQWLGALVILSGIYISEKGD